jgi:hypothetical protein
LIHYSCIDEFYVFFKNFKVEILNRYCLYLTGIISYRDYKCEKNFNQKSIFVHNNSFNIYINLLSYLIEFLKKMNSVFAFNRIMRYLDLFYPTCYYFCGKYPEVRAKECFYSLIYLALYQIFFRKYHVAFS